jgi:hypothetical protein
MPTCPGATKAIEEFLRDKPEKMLFLPDGGGFFVKGVATADNDALAGSHNKVLLLLTSFPK